MTFQVDCAFNKQVIEVCVISACTLYDLKILLNLLHIKHRQAKVETYLYTIEFD